MSAIEKAHPEKHQLGINTEVVNDFEIDALVDHLKVIGEHATIVDGLIPGEVEFTIETSGAKMGRTYSDEIAQGLLEGSVTLTELLHEHPHVALGKKEEVEKCRMRRVKLLEKIVPENAGIIFSLTPQELVKLRDLQEVESRRRGYGMSGWGAIRSAHYYNKEVTFMPTGDPRVLHETNFGVSLATKLPGWTYSTNIEIITETQRGGLTELLRYYDHGEDPDKVLDRWDDWVVKVVEEMKNES